RRLTCAGSPAITIFIVSNLRRSSGQSRICWGRCAAPRTEARCMCDTLVALPQFTARGAMLFGKNSDRPRNEAHVLELTAARDHEPGSQVACTYVRLPQVPHTHGVLVCRPFWSWGAEMAANDRGVVIGNEAVHARQAPPEVPALTGMDLVRLSAERGSSAAE